MNTSTSDGAKKKAKSKTREEVLMGFQTLRAEQRDIIQKIHMLEAELSELSSVIKSLAPLEPNRKCFRMIHGVLIEQNVGKVLPDLNTQVEYIKNSLENYGKALNTKGEELNAYKEEHNLHIGVPTDMKKKEALSDQVRPPPSGVLVS